MINHPCRGRRVSTPTKIILALLGFALLFSKLLYDLYSGAANTLQPNLANDAITHAWPLLSYARASVEAGVMPLWNPYTSLGTPYFAEIGMGIFFPLAWLALVMQVDQALVGIQLLTVAVGMAGMYGYARHLALEPLATLACVAVFAFALFTETFYPTMGYSFCMLPFVLWTAHRMIEHPDLPNSCYLAITIALCFLGGFPNYFIYTVLVVGVYCACFLGFLLPGIRAHGALKRLGMALVVAALMLGLVAVQLAPAYELSSLTYRNIDSGSAFDPNSLWENFSLKLLLANFVQTDLAHVFGNSFLELPASLAYMGGLLLFLPFAFIERKLRPAAFSLAVSGVFLCLFLLSYHVPALALMQKLPFASAIRVNGRAAGYIQFVAIVLCCIGLSNLLRTSRQQLVDTVVGLKLPALIVTAAYAAWLTYSALSANESLAFLVGYASCIALAALAVRGKPATKAGSALIPLLVIVAIVEVSYHRQNRFLVPAFHAGHAEQVAAARVAIVANTEQYRVVFMEQGFSQAAELANLGAKHQLPSIDAYIGLTSARWENYVRYMLGPETFDRLVARSPLQRFYGYFSPALLKSTLQQPEILGLASLRYVIEGDAARQLPHALPRAYAVGHYVISDSEEASLSAIRASDAFNGDTVVLEGAQPGFPPGNRANKAGHVTIERYAANNVTLTVSLRESAIVVLTDAYYPGWRAQANGNEIPIYRANSVFRAVELPAGEHRVEFSYRPTSLYIGAAITALSVLVITLLLGMTRR